MLEDNLKLGLGPLQCGSFFDDRMLNTRSAVFMNRLLCYDFCALHGQISVRKQ